MAANREQRFIERRRQLNGLWPYVGGSTLVLWIGALLYFFAAIPELVSPLKTAELLRADSVASRSQIELLATFAPICFLLFWFVVLAIILLGFVWYWNEKKLLRIIADSQAKSG